MTWFSRAAPSAADPKGGQPPQRGKEALRGPYQAHPGGGAAERARAEERRAVVSSKGVGGITREACEGEGEGGARTQLVRGAK